MGVPHSRQQLNDESFIKCEGKTKWRPIVDAVTHDTKEERDRHYAEWVNEWGTTKEFHVWTGKHNAHLINKWADRGIEEQKKQYKKGGKKISATERALGLRPSDKIDRKAKTGTAATVAVAAAAATSKLGECMFCHTEPCVCMPRAMRAHTQSLTGPGVRAQTAAEESARLAVAAKLTPFTCAANGKSKGKGKATGYGSYPPVSKEM